LKKTQQKFAFQNKRNESKTEEGRGHVRSPENKITLLLTQTLQNIVPYETNKQNIYKCTSDLELHLV
jgi:hypothetical protein